ncbi:MAG TPA: DUF6790 family protein [Thermoleophilia bacterium]|nr:DUF6790 family protein [Thermoleophilia bacterium]
MVKWISIASKVVAGVGIFLGFYYLGDDPQKSLAIVTITAVGVVGVLAFVRHFVFHKEDAKRLEWETDRPDWMWEVGFANLAFGGMGLLAVLADWGTHAQALALLGYSLYLFQAALLHGYRYFTDEKRSPARLWRGAILTLVLVGFMTFFAVYALLA